MTKAAGPVAAGGSDLPLAGLVILEIGNKLAPVCVRLATSLAGRIVADLGARVIKLEPPGGDPVRHKPPLLPRGSAATARSALFEFLNAGKTSLVLPDDPGAARASIEMLLSKRIDAVLLEDGDDARAAVVERGIAVVEVARWPDTMPVPGPRLSEFTALALGGLLDMVGDPDREPLRLGGHQASYSAGLSAFTALMALFAERDAGRPLLPARISLIESVMWVNWKAVAGVDGDGNAPTRQGASSEFQVVRCLDGWIAVVFTVTQFENLRDLVDNPALHDAKFSTRQGRLRHIRELYEHLSPWFAARTRTQVYAEAQARSVPLGPVCRPVDLLDDPQCGARDFIVATGDPSFGALRSPRLPVLWNGRSFAPSEAAEPSTLEAVLR
ncbi:crotonobetainyl-CoA:carnitine CoA-transferase CaiB-like acyl-CoA transferase [Bradyrhizobium sp. USDA 4341]